MLRPSVVGAFAVGTATTAAVNVAPENTAVANIAPVDVPAAAPAVPEQPLRPISLLRASAVTMDAAATAAAAEDVPPPPLVLLRPISTLRTSVVNGVDYPPGSESEESDVAPSRMRPISLLRPSVAGLGSDGRSSLTDDFASAFASLSLDPPPENETATAVTSEFEAVAAEEGGTYAPPFATLPFASLAGSTAEGAPAASTTVKPPARTCILPTLAGSAAEPALARPAESEAATVRAASPSPFASLAGSAAEAAPTAPKASSTAAEALAESEAATLRAASPSPFTSLAGSAAEAAPAAPKASSAAAEALAELLTSASPAAAEW